MHYHFAPPLVVLLHSFAFMSMVSSQHVGWLRLSPSTQFSISNCHPSSHYLAFDVMVRSCQLLSLSLLGAKHNEENGMLVHGLRVVSLRWLCPLLVVVGFALQILFGEFCFWDGICSDLEHRFASLLRYSWLKGLCHLSLIFAWFYHIHVDLWELDGRMPTMMIAIIWSEDLGSLYSLPPEGGFASWLCRSLLCPGSIGTLLPHDWSLYIDHSSWHKSGSELVAGSQGNCFTIGHARSLWCMLSLTFLT